MPPPTKVYTNKDLGAAPAPAALAPAAAGTKDTKDTKDTKEAKDTKDGKDAVDDKDAAGSKDGGDQGKSKQPKDKAYWSSHLKALQDRLDRDSGYSVALQTRINSLTTDFVNRDDPAQKAVIERDRQKALAELERLKKAVIDDKKAIADFEEEARRAGVPPGWLR